MELFAVVRMLLGAVAATVGNPGNPATPPPLPPGTLDWASLLSSCMGKLAVESPSPSGGPSW